MAGVIQSRKLEMEGLESPQSPYYINPTDNQVAAMVSPELVEGNYDSWRRSFELVLSIKNKLGFVDGSLPRPSEDDLLYPTWRRCNNLVKSWIQRSVSVPIASTIFYLDSAREIWEELKERYAEPDDSRICQLQLQYYGLVQGSKSVSAFYNEMLSLLRELRVYRPLPQCECGKCDCQWLKIYSEQHQKDMVFKFLNGLNEEFGALRTQILLRKPFPILGEAYNTVQRDDIQRNLRQNNSYLLDNPMMAAALTESKQKLVGAEELPAAMAAFEKKRGRLDLLREHCGKRGHLKDRCY